MLSIVKIKIEYSNNKINVTKKKRDRIITI